MFAQREIILPVPLVEMLSTKQDKEATAENLHGARQRAIGIKIDKSNSNILY